MPPPDQNGDGPDAVAASCDELWRYMRILERLLPEPVAVAGGAAPGVHRAAPQLPGHTEAFYTLMDAHDGLRRLEADLVTRAGLPYRGRGGSEDATADLLDRLPGLTVTQGERNRALYWLGKWITAAKAVHGAPDALRWRHLPRPRPGQDKPPQCPACHTYQLLADPEARVVQCSNPGCKDKNGVPAVAAMGTDPATGADRLYWADGTEEPGVVL